MLHRNSDRASFRAQYDFNYFSTRNKVGKTTKDNFQYDAFEETYYAKSVHCHNQNCKADGSPRVNDIALVRVERAISELERG